MKKYEYKTVLADEVLLSHSPDAILNEMGNDGWKLVAHCVSAQDPAQSRLIFARKKKEEKKEEDDD